MLNNIQTTNTDLQNDLVCVKLYILLLDNNTYNFNRQSTHGHGWLYADKLQRQVGSFEYKQVQTVVIVKWNKNGAYYKKI